MRHQIDNYDNNFFNISDDISSSTRSILYKSLGLFRYFCPLDVSKTEVFREKNITNTAYVDVKTGHIHIGTEIENVNRLDLEFILLHELRHLWQVNMGLITLSERSIGSSYLKENYVVWRGKENIPFSFMYELSLDNYARLPWEADANGFAHYAMGEYIPIDNVLSSQIKYCTKPKEFF